jgi:hypothetical protein
MPVILAVRRRHGETRRPVTLAVRRRPGETGKRVTLGCMIATMNMRMEQTEFGAWPESLGPAAAAGAAAAGAAAGGSG